MIYALLDEADIERLITDGSEISIGEFVLYGRPLNQLRTELEQDVADGVAWKSDTIEGLAEQIGLDPTVLAQTVAEYNTACDAGEDPKYLQASSLLETA